MAEYDGFDARRAFGRFRTAAGLGKPAGARAPLGRRRNGHRRSRGRGRQSRSSPVRRRASANAQRNWPTPSTRARQGDAHARRRTPVAQLDGQAERQIDGVGRVSYGTDGVKYEAAPEIAEKAGEAPLCNELSVPDGSKCLVTLEDGTRVWLNARSTLRYPVKFAAGERRVELSGEGLFDVTHDPEHPFVVEAGKATMTVRGTKFNVRDFDDEGMASTTLLEGCVEVGNRSGKVTLEPGMQSRTRGAAETLDVREVDPAAYTAWTEDKIAFYNADLEEVLADIRRWYRWWQHGSTSIRRAVRADGKIPRDFSLAQVIDLLEAITDPELRML
ncbi:MAG: FecR family protein [Alistipes shahii]|uniref:FecR family protein n=1 Tax=Alistipes shahii TaxID=328814 RepID=UPI00399D3EBF